MSRSNIGRRFRKYSDWDYRGIEILSTIDVVLLRGSTENHKEVGWLLNTKEARELRKDLELLGDA